MDDFSKIWDEDDACDDAETPHSSLRKEQGDKINYEIPASSSGDVAIEEKSEPSLPTEKKKNDDIPVSSVDDVLAEDEILTPSSSTREHDEVKLEPLHPDDVEKESGSQPSFSMVEKEKGDILVSSVDDILEEDEPLVSPLLNRLIRTLEEEEDASPLPGSAFSNRLIDELNTIGVMDEEPPLRSSTLLDTHEERGRESGDEEDSGGDILSLPDKPWRSKIWKSESPHVGQNVVKEELMPSDSKSVDNSGTDTTSPSSKKKKKKKKKKKRRSSEDEKLFKEMGTKICELGNLLVRQRYKTKKAQELLAVSEEDVLFLSRRFQQLGGGEENDEDKEQLSRILEQQQKSGTNADVNSENKSSTTTATLLNVKLRETKAKLRMEQQERQKFEEEALDLRKRFADSQNHAHDLKQELNFHTAKANELQNLVNETGGDAASVLEGIDLKSRLKVVQYELQKSRDQVERLELEKESNHGLVAELSSIIDPKGLFDEDLTGVLNNVRDGVEVNQSKAQELTIQHLTSLLEQAEDDKMKHIQKICSLQEQLASVKEELDQSQNGGLQQIPKLNSRLNLSRFRRSPNNKNNSPSPHSVMST